MIGDDWQAQKLFVNVVDSVCVCSVIVLYAQYWCLQGTWFGRTASRPVQGAIAGAVYVQGQTRKAVSAGVREAATGELQC